MIRNTREVSRAEYRHLRRQSTNLEALKSIAWVMVLTAFFFLSWLAIWGYWLEGVGVTI